MIPTVQPKRDQVLSAVRSLLQGALGGGIQVVKGLGNKVPAPKGGVEDLPPYVAMTPIGHTRLRTNIRAWPSVDANTQTIEQGLEQQLQIDCYGVESEDLANVITTLWRDAYACSILSAVCQPLYADDAKMMPLDDSEAQYEERWNIDARLQYNPIVTTSQQFATALKLVLINIQDAFPI